MDTSYLPDNDNVSTSIFECTTLLILDEFQ